MSEADEDLAEHGKSEAWRGDAGAGVADPVPQEDEEGGADKGEAGPAGVECVEGERGG